MLPGLYIVQNVGSVNAAVTLTGSTGKVLHAWSLQPGVQYTIFMEDGCAVEFSDGCLLRSMAPERMFQEGTSDEIRQGRYIVGLQLPERNYTFSGRDGEAVVRVTVPGCDDEKHSLSPGESWTLDIGRYATRELLVEMVNVDVSWEQGEG